MRMSLRSLLGRAERELGNRTAIIEGSRQFTYACVIERARRLASALCSLSPATSPASLRVAILDNNSARYLETYFACAIAGITIVPLNIRLASAELEQILQQVDAQILIVGPAFVELSSSLAVSTELVSPERYESLVASASLYCRQGDELADTAAIYYTSGTTGAPKGACLSEEGLLAGITDGIFAFALQPTDVWLHAAPMFHLADASAIWAVTAAGACHVVARFEPSSFLATIEKFGVTGTSIPPTLINMVVNSPDAETADVSSLKRISFGGSPISATLHRRACEVFRCELYQAYGITEAAGFVCCGLPGDELDAYLTIGRPVPSIELKILLDDGTEAATGQTGEIVIRGPKVMHGYWKNPDATALSFKDGWYCSGDLGCRNEQGLYSLVGRKKDMIISGGENVYAVEVENTLASHPAVLEAAVFGVADPQWGEAVHAVVSIREGTQATCDELKAWCRNSIAGYKTPKSIVVVTEPLPKSGSGKIAKHLLRSHYK